MTSKDQTEQEDEVDKMIMLFHGAFTRKVCNNYIIPCKSRAYYEDLRRVLVRPDSSPAGLYASVIVTRNLLEKLVVITPVDQFKDLLDAWKKQNPDKLEVLRNVVKGR